MLDEAYRNKEIFNDLSFEIKFYFLQFKVDNLPLGSLNPLFLRIRIQEAKIRYSVNGYNNNNNNTLQCQWLQQQQQHRSLKICLLNRKLDSPDFHLHPLLLAEPLQHRTLWLFYRKINKETVCVIPTDPPFKKRGATVTFKPLSDQ